MEEQMGKRFIRVAAVQLLLLLVAAVGERDLKRGMAKEQEEKGYLVELGISEASRQEKDGVMSHE